MAKEDLIKNAKMAKKIWDELNDEELKKSFKRNFHIRPKTSGVTLVTTHPSKPMNGNEKVRIRTKRSTGKADCYFDEDFIRECANLNLSKENLGKLGITKGGKGFEANLQAWLINVINDCENQYNKELKEALGINEIYFIGSELIFQEDVVKKGQRPDIVIHDGNGIVYILELKTNKGYPRKDGKNPHEQVQEYIEKYKLDEQYKNLLLNYPMVEKLDKITEYRGVVVKGDKNTETIYKDEDTGEIRIPEK